MPAKVNPEECTGCEACVDSCPEEAIAMNDDIAAVDVAKCNDCGTCVDGCPVEAISMEE